ncbi:monovalent cation/H(+) antiporter subunit G [Kineococcus sp. LSe6-4]|uniref:Monovalent cation/H(+) antiporter subunit G n=1 Tax=Kineococcus halophytocola TaxID=3234027 RepID=A0ABV4H3T1_9ACTN
MSDVLDVVAGVLVVAGAAFAVTAGVGLLRFGDLWLRIHAGSKPQVLGLLLVLLGTALHLRSVAASAALLLVAVFQVLTTPVSAHVLARAGHRSGAVPRAGLRRDDLAAHEAGDREDGP